MSDNNLVSTQEWELNYILRKYNFKETQSNRDKLKKIISDFKSKESTKPHNRENFYTFFQKQSLDIFEK
ncbi:hypothetical protein VXI38_001647 [Campylobacter jejuni]|nr:hypothetical protein [Campylobacter jejuni]EME0204916.1 hypothetical protein [Campylobacter jejuni]